MADNIIKKDANIVYNNIDDQKLTYANQLSIKAWNNIINSLKAQANTNTIYLEYLHKWLIGNYDINKTYEENIISIPIDTELFGEYIPSFTEYTLRKIDYLSDEDKNNKTALNNLEQSVNELNINKADLEYVDEISEDVDELKNIKADRQYVENNFLDLKNEQRVFGTKRFQHFCEFSDGVNFSGNPANFFNRAFFEKFVEFKDNVNFSKAVHGYFEPNESTHLVRKSYVDTTVDKALDTGKQYTDTKADETREYIDNQVSTIPKFNIKVVSELPATGSLATVYLKVVEDDDDANLYEEYIYVEDKWERLGLGRVDLSDYIKVDETKEAELKYTIVYSEEYNEDSDLEIPTNKVVKEVVNKALKNSQTELKKYSLPLSEVSWVRIAQVKDVKKNASGTFTFDCYSIDYEGNKKLFTTSQFSVSCGVNEKGEIITDVLPISQIPELKGSSNENGSGGGSGDGSGGSGGTGVYGLASIKIERFKNNLYVCGLINYPAIELYSSLDVEMKIDNNLNYQYLDTLEVVNLDYTNREESSLLEGTVLKANQSYEVKIGVNLQKYINGVNYQYPINVDLFQDNEQIFNFSYTPDIINVLLRYATSNGGTTSADNYPFDLIDFSLAQNGITFEDLANAYYWYNSDLLKSIDNYICKVFHYGIGYTRFRKISGTIYFNTTVESTGLDIEINGETVYNLSEGEIGSYTFENLILDKDIVDIGYGTLYKPNQKVVIDLEKSEIEIVIPLTMEQDVTITTYSIQHNDIYDFKLKLNVVDEHETSDSYNLYSMYNKIDNVENYARLGYLYGAEYINDRPTLLKPEFTVNLYEYPYGRDGIRGIFLKILGKEIWGVTIWDSLNYTNTLIYIDGADSYYYGYSGYAMISYRNSKRYNANDESIYSIRIEFQLLGSHKRYVWENPDLLIQDMDDLLNLDVPYKTLTMIDEEQYNSLLARIEALENK